MAQISSTFDLENFFPYKVRIFYRAVSERVASVYKEAYGLSVKEWRIMAVLGPTDGLTATEIVKRSSMDKVAISRAIQRLKERGFISQVAHPTDGRQIVLSLSDAGSSVFLDLIPRVQKAEQEMLTDLTSDERDKLAALMDKVRLSAEL